MHPRTDATPAKGDDATPAKAEQLLDRLESGGVVDVDGEEVRITEEYLLLRAENRGGCEVEFLNQLEANEQIDSETLTDYVTLRQMLGEDGYSHDELLRMVTAIQETLDAVPMHS